MAGALIIAAQVLLAGSALAAVPARDTSIDTSSSASLAARGGGGGSTTRGYDISYPQCGSAYPANPLFGIVGVNDGIVYSVNPCLASEIAWAGGTRGQLYANTGNPDPALSHFWPAGQQTPEVCDPNNLDTPECAFDYGFNAAKQSYETAAAAYGQLGLAGTPASTRWWLDVETSNSWRSDTTLNVAALHGEVAYLRDTAGVTAIGFYSTQQQWDTITGGTLDFYLNPSWLAGALSLKGAKDRCTRTAFTGNVIVYTQYPYQGFDANYVC